ncbi:hypothetical protein B0H13DRAFT_2365018 [Mycena leptocephala]|nr:hypothetical protein B0H13DRAFT_2365018 [Mycena leptocephala]
MPPKQPTFKCGAQGCQAAPFSQVSLLREHTAQAHPKSPSGSPLPKPPTFKCGSPEVPFWLTPAKTTDFQVWRSGCQAAPFSQVSLLHEHTAQAHPKSPSGSPLPKPPTFKCGVQGCEAAPFSQVSLLHEHTAQAHPKSNNNTPSGSPLPKQPTYKCGVQGCEAAPFSQVSLLHEHTAQAHPKSPSGSPLPKQPTFKCGAQGCQAAPFSQVSLLHEHTAQAHPKSPSGSFLDRLQERVEWMSKHNNVCSLAYSAKFRADVRMLLQDFDYNDIFTMQEVFDDDDRAIEHLFREVIHSGKDEFLHLSNEEATGFMDALHKCIMASDDAPFVLPARRLLKTLCAATKAFPPTLFLELDSVDTSRQIGRGGFADIFRGRYKGQDIALKRLQVYQPKPSEMLQFSKTLLQEVLTWVHLKHIYVLPFFGLDEKSFEGYPPCIVTPYMRNGAMNNFVKNRNGTLPNRRVDQLVRNTS